MSYWFPSILFLFLFKYSCSYLSSVPIHECMLPYLFHLLRVVHTMPSVISTRTSTIYLCIYIFRNSYLYPYSYVLMSFQPISILLLLHSVIIRFLPLPIYLFLDVFRCVSHLLTSYINFHILPSCLQNFAKNI